MAKKSSKRAKVAEKKKGIEAVGWRFWLVWFVILYGPGYYIGYTYSYDDRKAGLLPWVIGFSLAAFVAGVISLVVNYSIQKRIELQRKRARKSK